MTSKDLHIAIKFGKGYEYMAEKYGFESQEKLYEYIQKKWPSESEGFIRDLESNQKAIDKKKRKIRSASRASENVATLQAINDALCEEVTETSESEAVGNCFESCESESTFVTVEEPMENMAEEIHETPISSENDEEQTELEKLQAEEISLSEKICLLESEHKEFCSRRAEILNQLDVAKKAFEELKKAAEEKQKTVENLCSEYSKLAQKMRDINEKKSSENERLEEVRSQIRLLNKVYIFVYEDGNIDVENAEMVTIQDDLIRDTLWRLVEEQIAEDITVKMLKAVVRASFMVLELQKQNIEVELNFESEKAQEVFARITTMQAA